MTKIALLRHYPTEWNAQRRLQGQTDIPLSPDARDLLRSLQLPAPWNAARLVSSPLTRAVETAQALAAGREVTTHPALVELSWGRWEGRTAEDLANDPSADFVPTHLWSGNTCAPGGESPNQAWDRVRPGLASIAQDDMPAVIVSHKALMRLILVRAGVAQPEIKRGRLYPLTLGASGLPRDAQAPVRLIAR